MGVTRPKEAPTPTIAPDSPDRFINRELSWLDFNHRVVEEAENTRPPACWSACASCPSARPTWTNSSPWRVAGLIGQVRSGIGAASPDGRTPAQQVAAVRERAGALLAAQQKVWLELKAGLEQAGLEGRQRARHHQHRSHLAGSLVHGAGLSRC